jgi:hypothetical protein
MYHDLSYLYKILNDCIVDTRMHCISSVHCAVTRMYSYGHDAGSDGIVACMGETYFIYSKYPSHPSPHALFHCPACTKLQPKSTKALASPARTTM